MKSLKANKIGIADAKQTHRNSIGAFFGKAFKPIVYAVTFTVIGFATLTLGCQKTGNVGYITGPEHQDPAQITSIRVYPSILHQGGQCSMKILTDANASVNSKRNYHLMVWMITSDQSTIIYPTGENDTLMIIGGNVGAEKDSIDVPFSTHMEIEAYLTDPYGNETRTSKIVPISN